MEARLGVQQSDRVQVQATHQVVEPHLDPILQHREQQKASRPETAQGMSERSWDPKAFCVVPEVLSRSPHHQGPLHGVDVVDVALVLDGEIRKSCHTAGFQTSDHRLGIFKVAQHVGGGFADLWAHMVRSCSQELGLVSEPV